MKDEVRILLLEGSAPDADLIRRVLLQGGLPFNLERVDNRSAFALRLEKAPPDLILSDFSLPDLDGYAALAIAWEHCPDVPFIFVTGTLGEEGVIEALKKGATDCVLKHRLSRLVPAVHRAMREAKERSDRKRAEEQFRQSHAQLHTLSVYLQYVREEERIRIARAVHDELGQSLTGVKLGLSWLANRLPLKLNPLHAKARSLARRIDETIHAIRRIATELRPSLLDTAGLLAALEWQANEFEKQTAIRCSVTTTVHETQWDQDLNTAFFRIFQETLVNIIRHANASEVQVRLLDVAGYLVLEVQDNGRGISEEEIHNTSSIGLLGMRERAALLGGNVHWRSEPGKGTTVIARVPYTPARTDKSELPNPLPAKRLRSASHKSEAHAGRLPATARGYSRRRA